MKFVVTGMRGTLAPVVARAARDRAIHVTTWDRARVDPNDVAASAAWLDEERPDAILHLATGGVDWTLRLARYASKRSLPFVFTSTAMVFHHEPDGPHRVDDARTAQDDYGRSKIACEDAVLTAHPGASIARIGWQIDPAQPGNNMLLALDAWQARDGHVAASRAWRPACSFMEDTAATLVDLAQRRLPGVHHFDSNAVEGHDFAAIVRALKHRFDRSAWVLREHEEYRHDQRLIGGALTAPPLSLRLPALRDTV